MLIDGDRGSFGRESERMTARRRDKGRMIEMAGGKSRKDMKIKER